MLRTDYVSVSIIQPKESIKFLGNKQLELLFFK